MPLELACSLSCASERQLLCYYDLSDGILKGKEFGQVPQT